MIVEILGIPVPWKAHAGYGRRSFNPRFKEKEYVQWQIRSQNNRSEAICGPVRLLCTFHMPVPKSTSKIRTREMLDGKLHHIKRPDLTNLYKFVEDCLKTILFEDDSQVVEVTLRKIYSSTPKTVVVVEELNR